MALSAQVVDLIRLDLRHQSAQIRRIRQISVVKEEFHTLVVRILVQVVNSTRVERRGTTNDTVYLVTLPYQRHYEIPTFDRSNSAR